MAEYLKGRGWEGVAVEAVARFHRRHKGRNISYMFIDREVDNEFAAIGRVVLGEFKADRLKKHFVVWTGYETVIRSQYAEFKNDTTRHHDRNAPTSRSGGVRVISIRDDQRAGVMAS